MASRDALAVSVVLRATSDVVASGLAVWAGALLAGAPSGPSVWLEAGAFALIVVTLFHFRGLYRDQTGSFHLAELARVVKATLLAGVVLLAVRDLSGVFDGAYAATLATAGAALVLLPAFRRLAISLVGLVRRATGHPRRILIYGCGDTGRLVMKKIVHAPQLGWRVVGFLDDFRPIGSVFGCRTSQTSEARVEARILGRLRDLERVAAEHEVDELLVAAPGLDADLVHSILEDSGTLGLRVGFVPDLGSVRPDQLSVEELGAIPILRQPGPPARRAYLAAKRALDVALGSLLALILAPAWAVSVLLIRLDSPGPALFIQERVGLRGRRFRMLKLRTMYRDAEPYASAPTDERDPRITRVGRWLRSAGFDETPQLLNVLRGDMSLVGPRPEMPFVVEGYSSLERERLTVKPGITGLWQLGSDRQAEIHHNLEYDLHYVRNASLLLDALILCETGIFAARILLLQLVRSLGLAGSRGREPSEAPQPGAPDRFFVFFALDQRFNGRTGRETDELRRLLLGAHELARRWPVRILAADRNVRLFDRLTGAEGGSGNGERPEYVAYRSRAGVETVAAEAGVVVTDIPSVARWARRNGIALLHVHGERLALEGLSGEATAVADTLIRSLDGRIGDGVRQRRLRSG